MESRKHGQNMSGNRVEQLRALFRIFKQYQARNAPDALTLSALREGRALKRKEFASEMVREAASQWRARHRRAAIESLAQSVRWTPYFTTRALLAALARRASRVLPRPAVRWINSFRGEPYPIPIGSIGFGDLRRLSPISRGFGCRRGMPVDRYYIERFLAQNASDIRGVALEIADNNYTVRFGGERVTHSEILHLVPGNPAATIVGNLATGEGVPRSAFDCIILTQTLLMIYEVKQAVIQLRDAMRPGGVALVTVPGISQISRYDMDRWGDYWRFTDVSARRLFGDVFGPENVTVVTYGNVLTSSALLQGIAVQELRKEELDHHDVDYQVIIAIRAVRSIEPQKAEHS